MFICMKFKNISLLLVALISLSCSKNELLHTERTEQLIDELLEKLDSTEFYIEKREKELVDIKSKLNDSIDVKERFHLHQKIANKYSSYKTDSAITHLEKAIRVAEKNGLDSLKIHAKLNLSAILSNGGFYVEAKETLEEIPHNYLQKTHLADYYMSWIHFYHGLYSSYCEPKSFEDKYRAQYNIYRDSLLNVVDTTSLLYYSNMEKDMARMGKIKEAKHYNDLRLECITDHNSHTYTAWLYDRYLLDAYYNNNLNEEAINYLLQSAIIEVCIVSYDIASLCRVEELLNKYGRPADAKKISDYYYASLRHLGSRKRLVEGGETAFSINEENFNRILKKNRELVNATLISIILLFALICALIVIRRNLRKITKLNARLECSGKISKKYVGVLFKLYSSYIQQLDQFRTKVHSTLRKGNVEQALDLTRISGDISSNERRILFKNFDSAFVEIYPDFIEIVNSCLKPECKIVPKKTEILNNELRILALIKLGIEDSNEISEILICSVRTVYNLRASFKARLAIPEKQFKSIISEL